MNKSIAFVTPWPPNVMGVGETCFTLVKQLAQISSWRFTVYTDNPHPAQISGVSVQALVVNEQGLIDVAVAVQHLQQHDLVVHQIGNSSAHAFQWPLLKAFPSVCHFHDLIYQNFWAWYYIDFIKNPQMYYSELFRFYPELERQYISKNRFFKLFGLKDRHVPFWELVDLSAYPFIEPHVEKSIGVIVHSDFSKKIIEKTFPDRLVYKIPLHKGDLASIRLFEPSDQLHFGIFGNVIPNKKVDLIFKTFARLSKEFSNWRITLVGPVNENCHSLYQLVKKLGIDEKVTFLGKVDKTVYLEQLNQIDCCMNLRCPSFGESSGVVTECLILGIPVLVTDLMWYSELPSFVDKIHPGDLECQLYTTLRHYFVNPEILTKKREISRAYASQNLSYFDWVENYLLLLRNFCN